MDRRSCERFLVAIEVKLYCCRVVLSGTVKNVSERGMFISTEELCFPFDSSFEVSFPLKEGIVRVPVILSRIEMSPDSKDGFGVELSNPPKGYLDFVKDLASAS